MKRILKNKLVACLLTLVAAGCVGIIIALLRFFCFSPERVYAETTISFSYEGIEKGLNPDGAGLDIYKLKAEKIISQALENAGLSETYSVESIQDNLSVTGVLPKNVIERITASNSAIGNTSAVMNESEYYPTRFTVRLYNDFNKKISQRELCTLLRGILDSYQESFYNTYSKKLVTDTAIDISSLKTYDYSEAIDILKVQLELMKSFVEEMEVTGADFKSASTGLTFAEIKKAVSVLETTDLDKVSSNVYINVLTKDKNTLREYYGYTISQWEIDLAAENQALQTVNTALKEYKKDDTIYMASGDTIEKIAQNSSESYDKLLKEQLDSMERIAQLNADISLNEKRMADLSRLNNSTNLTYQRQIDQVEKDLQALVDKIADWMTKIEQITEEYYRQFGLRDAMVIDTTTEYQKNSVLSVAFIIEVIKCAAPLCILVLIGYAAWFMRDEIKKYNSDRITA